MEQRINIQELEPKAYQAMFGLEKYLSTSEIDKILIELIKLRASQINGCAYCIEMHVSIAIELGEKQNRLFALNAWQESPLFTAKERAVLAMTDEITNIANKGLSDKTYNEVKAFFTKNEIAQLIMVIGTINTWNRIAISTHMFYEE